MLKYFVFLYPQGVLGKSEVVCGWDIIRVELLKGCKEAMEKNTKNALIKIKCKQYSPKCHLFVITSGYAVTAWQSVTKETKGNTISANTVIHNLYRLDAENFSKVYALDEAIFRKLNSKSCGVTLASCKVARLLSEKLQEYIEKEGEIKSIY